MSKYIHDKPETDEKRNRALKDAFDMAQLNPGQTILNMEILMELGDKRVEYHDKIADGLGTNFNQMTKIKNVNSNLAELRMLLSHGQQNVKFKVDEHQPGWPSENYLLYDMAESHPIISPTGSLSRVKDVSEKFAAGEHIRVVVNGGLPFDYAIMIATKYGLLIAPGGLLAQRTMAIQANNNYKVDIAALNIRVDPFLTMIQKLIMDSAIGMTKEEMHAMAILWGIKFISIGDPSTFNIELKDSETMAALVGGVCSIGKSDVVPPNGPVMAHGAKGTTNPLGMCIIMTQRFGGIEIVIDMPGYDQKIVQMTTLEASTHTVSIPLHKTPPVVLV